MGLMVPRSIASGLLLARANVHSDPSDSSVQCFCNSPSIISLCCCSISLCGCSRSSSSSEGSSLKGLIGWDWRCGEEDPESACIGEAEAAAGEGSLPVNCHILR